MGISNFYFLIVFLKRVKALVKGVFGAYDWLAVHLEWYLEQNTEFFLQK